MRCNIKTLLGMLFLAPALTQAAPDWKTVDPEILRQFQTLLRVDTSNPPGNETVLVQQIAAFLRSEGIESTVYSRDPARANLVARLRGNGSKKPLLIMGHLDVVTVDPAKWRFPPFAGTLDSKWVYGRGTIDDKDDLVASLMTLVLIKRGGVALDRDVIFLAEAGEEGGTEFGIQHVVGEHFADIDAEYCLAEGGRVTRQGGKPLFAGIETVEKKRRTAILTVNGVAGHGSVPTQSNAVVHLGKAIAALGEWQGPLRLSDTTTTTLSRLASVATPAMAARYRALLNPQSPAAAEAMQYLLANEPATAALLHDTITPTIMNVGYRYNVIPSQGSATLDVRLLPDQDYDSFLNTMRGIINDPAIDVRWDDAVVRPSSNGRLNTEAYKVIEQVFGKYYGVPVIPVMSNGATDMTFLRAKGVACYGIGPGIDEEDAALGYGMHSDLERILESELYTYVHAYYDIVTGLAATAAK